MLTKTFFFWGRVASGKSRISQRWGKTKEGANLLFGKIILKTAWKLNLEKGAHSKYIFVDS